MKRYEPMEIDITPTMEGIDRIMAMMLPKNAQIMGIMEIQGKQHLLALCPMPTTISPDVPINNTHEQRMFVWIRRGSGMSLPGEGQVPKFIAKLEDYLVPSEFSAHQVYNGVTMTLYLFEILDSSPPIKSPKFIGRSKPNEG